MITRGVPDLHPDSEYFYELNWAGVLADGVTIDSASWTVPAGLSAVATSQSDATVGVKLSVDTAAIGSLHDIVCQIVTSTDLTLHQILRVRVGYEGY